MKDNVNQSLSAMMDDETESFEVRRTLDQLDSESLATWSRYQAASAVLKGDKVASIDISSAVMEALASDPEIHVKTDRSGYLTKPFASVAVAASVTAAVIFGVQNFQSDPQQDGQLALQESQFVLPSTPSTNSGVIPAQFGDLRSAVGATQQPGIVRISSPMGEYIDQHETMNNDLKHWEINWLPKGYVPLSHDIRQDTEIMRYSDGDSVISVFIEPYRGDKVSGTVVQSGDVLALGKQVDSRFVTVVGNVPLMVADRIATAVQPIH